MRASLQQIAEAIEALAPLELAESWDRTGLQVGDPRKLVDSVLVALDPSPGAVAEAKRVGAELIITHHPLFLRPFDRIDLSTPRGGVVAELLGNGIALYAAHTNLDRAEGGVNDVLARALGLEGLAPLGAGEAQVKIVVTVPSGYELPVQRALFTAGAGRVGEYRDCCFAVRGEGSFIPGPGAAPFLGEAGTTERVQEVRLEVVAPRARVCAVSAALREAHPYQEPAVDVYPLENPAASGAPGRIGSLGQPRHLGDWAVEVGRSLGAPGVRWVGDPSRKVERVAVCGGSGAELWGLAKACGADVLITGDLKYHIGLDVGAAGFAVVDVGHGPSESGALEALRDRVQQWAAGCEVSIRVSEYWEPDPFHWATM